MKKFALTIAAFGTMVSAMAGGFLTNTNQSVAFLRNPARNAAIGIDGVYSNPAGIGFLNKGWHLSFNIQSAYQTRDITSTYGPFMPGADYPFNGGTINGTPNPFSEGGWRKFNGKAKAPVIPSVDVAHVWDKFSIAAHFGITGGGGKCEFNNGLGLFESQVALVPTIINTLHPGMAQGYSADTYVRGRQYYWGGQLNFGYKVMPSLNVSAGFRVVYASCNYYGYVRNISTTVGGQQMKVADLLSSPMVNMPDLAAIAADRELNCDQNGWGVTPVIGIDWKQGKWNLAARWEMKTRMRLKNRSVNDTRNTSGLAEFDDGKTIAADLPTIISLGVQYEVLPTLRVNVGGHIYDDKHATQYEHREDLLRGPGWEVLAGVEWDVTKRLTLSAGAQRTNYGLGNNSRFLNNISFVNDSYSFGLGGKVNVSKKVAVNFAYFKTIYKSYKKKMSDYNGLKATIGGQVGALAGGLAQGAEELNAGIQQMQAAINSGMLTGDALTEMQNKLAQAQGRLGIINGELGAINAVAPALGQINTAGYDVFRRTNDVFGIGVDIAF